MDEKDYVKVKGRKGRGLVWKDDIERNAKEIWEREG